MTDHIVGKKKKNTESPPILGEKYERSAIQSGGRERLKRKESEQTGSINRNGLRGRIETLSQDTTQREGDQVLLEKGSICIGRRRGRLKIGRRHLLRSFEGEEEESKLHYLSQKKKFWQQEEGAGREGRWGRKSESDPGEKSRIEG